MDFDPNRPNRYPGGPKFVHSLMEKMESMEGRVTGMVTDIKDVREQNRSLLDQLRAHDESHREHRQYREDNDRRVENLEMAVAEQSTLIRYLAETLLLGQRGNQGPQQQHPGRGPAATQGGSPRQGPGTAQGGSARQGPAPPRTGASGAGAGVPQASGAQRPAGQRQQQRRAHPPGSHTCGECGKTYERAKCFENHFQNGVCLREQIKIQRRLRRWAPF